MRLVLSAVLTCGALALALPLLLGRPANPPGETAEMPATSKPERDPADAIYRWRDTRGTIHIASQPPGGDTLVERYAFERAAPDASERKVLPEPARRPSGLDSVEESLERLGGAIDQLRARDRTMESLEKQL